MTIDELSSSLRSTAARFHKSLRKHMSPAQSYSMTELETIGLLFQHGTLMPTQLAAMTHVKTQSMSQIIHKIEEQGIIKRTPSKEDKRKVYLSLTAAGKKLVENTQHEIDAWLIAKLEVVLTDKEREVLVKALPLLEKLIEVK